MNEKIFSDYTIKKAFYALAFPAMLSQLTNVLYNMVDMFFIAASNDSRQIAAVSIAHPVLLLLMCIGALFGFGGGVYISQKLGEKDSLKANNSTSYVFWMTVVIGIIVGILGMFCTRPLAIFLGSDSDTLPYSIQYLRVCFIGAPIFTLSNGLVPIIRGEGASREASIGIIAGTIANIILDPLMISYLGWGVCGAAIATVIGNGLSCVIYIWYLLSKRSVLSFHPKYFSLDPDMQKSIILLGLPPVMTPVFSGVSNICMNNLCALHGSETVAAMGLASRVFGLISMIQLGMSQGMTPFIGYNFAAKQFNRLRECMKFSAKFSFVLGLGMTAFFYIFRMQLIGIFMKDDVITPLGAHFLCILTLTACLLGITNMFISWFQGCSRPVQALVVSTARQGYILIPLFYLFHAIAGIDGVMFATCVAEIITMMIGAILYRRVSAANAG